jgi:ubiquinone biosynthesis protein Coq4
LILNLSEKAQHIETNCAQKIVLALGSSILALIDPTKGEHIATLGETTGSEALKIIQKKMNQDATGRRILQEKPYINSSTLDMNALSLLPTNTFGYGYYKFMSERGFSADER